jgi:hypothetical protein
MLKLLEICKTASAHSKVSRRSEGSGCGEASLEISRVGCEGCSAWIVLVRNILSKLLAALSYQKLPGDGY